MASTSRHPSLRILLSCIYLSHHVAASTKENTPPQVCSRGIAHPFVIAHQILTTTGSDPASFTPWTHRPFCRQAADSPWCVYTNADPSVPVASGIRHHGISIVTTPEQAAGSMSLLEHVGSSAVITYIKRLYKVAPVTGKGLGARKDAVM